VFLALLLTLGGLRFVRNRRDPIAGLLVGITIGFRPTLAPVAVML
jgi:hypothetical protein